MKEYSLENSDFKKISLTQATVLLEILANNQGRDFSYIKEKYQKSERFFDETFLFFSKFGIVTGSGELNDTQLKEGTSGVKELFLKKMFKSGIRVGVLLDYLSNFSLVEGLYIFKPSVQKNLQTSGIRNFLIELDFLVNEIDKGIYIISDYGLIYFKSFLRHTSAAQFELILRQRDKIGLQAELAVLKYERNLLKKFPKLAKKINHVSRSNVGAGYDIESFSPLSSGSHKSKYIEVKAVSDKTYDFFWSSNEIEVAKNYGPQYYLYLLPVLKRNTFDIKKLKIISDPYQEIYRDKRVKELESVLFHVSPLAE